MAQDRVEAVEKALSLLECFSEDKKRLSLADFAAQTGLYKSTILRLLKSLERYHYIYRTPEGRYELGNSITRLSPLVQKQATLEDYIRPVLRDLRDHTGETASFYIRKGNRRICLYRENSTRALRHHLDEGTDLPLETGAAGRLLQQSDSSHIDYTLSKGERDPDLAALAVPVPLPDTTFGALTLSGLITHFDTPFQERHVPYMHQKAKDLSLRIPSHLPL